MVSSFWSVEWVEPVTGAGRAMMHVQGPSASLLGALLKLTSAYSASQSIEHITGREDTQQDYQDETSNSDWFYRP